MKKLTGFLPKRFTADPKQAGEETKSSTKLQAEPKTNFLPATDANEIK